MPNSSITFSQNVPETSFPTEQMQAGTRQQSLSDSDLKDKSSLESESLITLDSGTSQKLATSSPYNDSFAQIDRPTTTQTGTSSQHLLSIASKASSAVSSDAITEQETDTATSVLNIIEQYIKQEQNYEKNYGEEGTHEDQTIDQSGISPVGFINLTNKALTTESGSETTTAPLETTALSFLQAPTTSTGSTAATYKNDSSFTAPTSLPTITGTNTPPTTVDRKTSSSNNTGSTTNSDTTSHQQSLEDKDLEMSDLQSNALLRTMIEQNRSRTNNQAAKHNETFLAAKGEKETEHLDTISAVKGKKTAENLQTTALVNNNLETRDSGILIAALSSQKVRGQNPTSTGDLEGVEALHAAALNPIHYVTAAAKSATENSTKSPLVHALQDAVQIVSNLAETRKHTPITPKKS